MDKGNFKKIEAILYSYNEILTDIKCIEIDIMREEAEYRGCGSIDYSSESSKSNAFNSSVENEVVQREKNINKLKNRLLNKQALKDKIDIIIESLPENEKELIKARYLKSNPESWDEISKKLRFSTSHCSKAFRKKVIGKFVNIAQ